MAYAGVNETPAHIWSRKDGKYGEQQLENHLPALI